MRKSKEYLQRSAYAFFDHFVYKSGRYFHNYAYLYYYMPKTSCCLLFWTLRALSAWPSQSSSDLHIGWEEGSKRLCEIIKEGKSSSLISPLKKSHIQVHYSLLFTLSHLRHLLRDSYKFQKSISCVILRYLALQELKTFKIVPVREQREGRGVEIAVHDVSFFSSQNDAWATSECIINLTIVRRKIIIKNKFIHYLWFDSFFILLRWNTMWN